MSQATYSSLKSYVQNRLDLRDEGFITTTELLQYTEEALRYCEAEVHKLNIEDMYFEAESYIQLVSGQQDYNLPSNIYANKILRLVSNRNGQIYEIPRLTHSRRFELSAQADRYGSGTDGQDFEYRLINNNPTDGTKIRIHPIPTISTTTVSFTATSVSGSSQLTAVSSVSGLSAGMFLSGTGIRAGTRIKTVGSTTIDLNQSASAAGTGTTITAIEDHVRIHYIRKVEIPALTTDYIDFPEFWNFIAQHVVVACLKKELGNPRLPTELDYLKELKEQMSATLSDMVPDQNNDLVEMDLSHYNGMGHNDNIGGL